MATIPAGTKFIGIGASVPTPENKSSQNNGFQEVYTIEDIIADAAADSEVVDDLTPQLGGDLDVNGKSIISVSNGDINITPNGTGVVKLDGLTYPSTDGVNGQFMQTNGSGVISFATVNTGLTIGTTAITSGTVGRILFEGTGNVVQEDAGFLFSSSDKSLTNYGKGAVTSNTSFGALVFQAGTGLGTANTAVGWAAANYLTTGSSNTMIGYRAGGGVLGSNFTGNNNTLIGAGAGLYLSSGIQNTFVGNNTGTSITTGSYNTILGHYTGSLPAATIQNVILSDGAGIVALWKNSSHFNGFGYNPLTDTLGAKLDVRAQGALSTDIAFRVRNSADNDNIAEIAGNGLFRFGSTSGYHISLNPTSPSLRGQNGATVAWQLSPWGGEHSWLTNNATNQNLIGIGTTSPTDKLHVYNTINDYRIRVAVGASNPADESCGIRFTTTWAGTSFGADAANLVIRTKGTNNANTQRTALEFRMNTLGTSALRASLTGQSNFLLQSPTEDINDIGVIYIPNGTAPTASIIDGYKQYSADIVAGNASPHFRTENGSVIKLYKEAALTVSDGTLANAVTRIAELEARLQAFGLIG